MSNAAVFLDRDGTLNVDKGYVHRLQDWEWIPGAIDSLVALKKAGFLLIVITNQAGIAREYYKSADMEALHDAINHELNQHGVSIDGFYHCPHHPKFGDLRECNCRKPEPGMILQAHIDFDIDLGKSWLIGDKFSDIQAGLDAGVKSILVMTGYGDIERNLLNENGICEPDIASACKYITSHS